jgi:uncharacterized membrane protein
MNKMILIPIIALVLMTVQKVLGFEFSTEELQIINDGLLAIAVLIGILTNPKKPQE